MQEKINGRVPLEMVWSISGRNQWFIGMSKLLREQVKGFGKFHCPSAPGKVRRILRGESPRRVRVGHPPVSSLASMAESSSDDEQYGRSVDRESCRP